MAGSPSASAGKPLLFRRLCGAAALIALSAIVPAGCQSQPWPVAGPEPSGSATYLDSPEPSAPAGLPDDPAVVPQSPPVDAPDGYSGIPSASGAPIHATVQFEIDPVDGPCPLTSTLRAVTVDSGPLPRGNYTWTIDGDVDSGPLETHSVITRQFANPGVYTVMLALTTGGLTSGCVSSQTRGLTGRVSVLAVVSGEIHDEDGKPVSGVVLSAPGASPGTAITDVAGRFTFRMPAGWTGVITPQHFQYTFDPPNRSFSAVQAGQAGQDFTALPQDSAVGRWIDTGPDNSMEEDDSLFDYYTLDDREVFGTVASAIDIHSHFVGPDTSTWSSYEYTGRMRTDNAAGGLGVTFFSDYPRTDSYYRLRQYNGGPFHIAPHPRGQQASGGGGITTTNVVPEAGVWYRFRVLVADAGSKTEVRAKVWEDGTPEPSEWQIDCYDDSADRRRTGTFGVWSMNPGGHYWDRLRVNGSSPDGTEDPDQDEAPDDPDGSQTCSSDDECDDGLFCNGQERCVNGSCVTGPRPCAAAQTCNEATDACETISGWQPPIGIPVPEFGINQTVESVYGSAGYYTHYVDAAASAATDTNNPAGSPSKPRLTIPSTLAAGSVVYVRGGTYSASSMSVIRADGTPSRPVFIRGNPAARPTITIETAVRGTYFIVENIDFNGTAAQANVLGPSHHVAIRYCEVRNARGNGAGLVATGSWSGTDPTTVKDVVFHANTVHDLGNLSASSDEDHHGFVVGHHASRIWIVDNEIYNCSGSGLQVNSGFLDSTGDRPAHHIYVGRNHVHHVRQSGLAVKEARDGIFSQNDVHDVIDTSWSTAKGLAYQYGPYNLWFIYNHLHDTTWGINGPSNDNGPGGNVYFVGNLIHDCDMGMTFWNNTQLAHIAANTLYNLGQGIRYENGTGMRLTGNILANMSNGPHIEVSGGSGATAANSGSRHDLFHQAGGSIAISWGGRTYNTIPLFRAGSGTGDNDLEADPRFVNAAAGDFRLRPDSPAVNAGTIPDVYATFYSLYGLNIQVDYDGTPRPVGSQHDIGAFER